MKLPAIHFYPGDWLRDHVAGCSLGAQGLWLRMMILMHDSERYGHLCLNGSPIPPESLARRCGCDSLAQYESLLAELESATVPSRTNSGVIYSRRMVRDDRKRKDGVTYGKQGGNPKLKKTLNPPLKGKPEDESEDESSFSEFYKVYPRKEKPADAKKAWKQVNGPKYLKDILSALEWQKITVQWTKSNGDFIPLPSSYLRSESWRNEKSNSNDSTHLLLRPQ